MVTVLVPPDLERRLTKLAGRDEGANGLIFATARGPDLALQYLVLTNLGRGVHLQTSPERMPVVDELLTAVPPAYRVVHFHTHSSGTVATAPLLATHFTKNDVGYYTQQAREDPQFLALLVTPKKRMLYGRDSQTSQVTMVQDGQIFSVSRDIEFALRDICRGMGVHPGNFTSLGFL